MKARALFGVVLVMATTAAAAAWAISSTGSCSRESLAVRYNSVRGDPYPFDSFERSVTEDGGVVCPEVELVMFDGDAIRLSPPAKVAAPFAERLRRFEAVVVEVAKRHYGRAPRSIVNDGAYFCRSVRHREYRLSEHALGNALDVVGFDFGPLPANLDAGAATLPKALRGTLRVRVEKHWKAEVGEADIHHARFLDDLTSTLDERDVFRAILGPSHPTHKTHYHFDMGPWSYVMP